MFAFDYRRASSVAEAAELLLSDADAQLIAGGQTLIPTLKQRLASPSCLIDLGGVPELVGVGLAGDYLVIGAMTKHADLAASAIARETLPALARLASLIGDPLVRNRGTIGGSLANNDPSADYPAGCLALGARIVTDWRSIAADDFFLGMFETALEPGEIIVRVEVPVSAQAAYEKFPHPASRYAMAGVFVAKRGNDVRIAVTGAAQNGVFRWTQAEDALASNFAVASLDGLALPADDMIQDVHATGAYRAHLITVLTARAVAQIVS